jgi:hypothetical protein
MNTYLRAWLLPGACLFLVAPAALLAEDNAPTRTAVKTTSPAEVPAGPVVRFDGAGRRDPFINPLLIKKADEVPDEDVSRGAAPPGISGMYIAEVAFLGVSLQPEGRTAVFRGPDKRVYFLQAGDRLFDGYVKNIDANSVLLVRETKKKSGKTITEDVHKKLRTP